MAAKRQNSSSGYHTSPPTDWVFAFRDTPQASHFSIHYRTGGAGKGYRQLEPPRPIPGPGPDVISKDGATTRPHDAASDAAELAWEAVIDHLGELRDNGKKWCSYQLHLHDQTLKVIDGPIPSGRQRTDQLDDDDDGDESDGDGRNDLIRLYYEQNRMFHKQAESSLKAAADLVNQASSLITNALGAAKLAGAGEHDEDPRVTAARILADAQVREARTRELGGALRELVGDLLGAFMPGSPAPHQPDLAVVLELATAGESDALQAYLRNDKTAARSSGAADECRLFWSWANG